MLLERQSNISHQHPMPIDAVDDSSAVTDVAGETVTLVIASTNANSAGEAAGTVVYARLTNSGVLDSAKIRTGHDLDTSFAFVTGTVLVTQIGFPYGVWEDGQFSTRAAKMAAVGALLSNGQFVLDHRTGLIIGKKATTADSDTAGYSYRKASLSTSISGTVTVDSEFPAAAATTDNMAAPSTTSVRAMNMVYDGANFDMQRGDATDGTLVNLGANNDVTETNSAAIAASASVLDDWDESDRAKVNLIAGQAGIAGGTGTDGATVPRVTLATNVALPAGTNNIGDVDVLTVPRSEMGPGQPGTAVDSYTHASFNLAAGADQVLVSSAPNKQIWVYGIGFTVNVAGTVSFQDEDNTAITGIMQFGATGGMAVSPSGNFSMPIWKLATDKDLEVDVVTSELDGWVDYAIISV